MGTYVNPDNDGFQKALKAGNYVDKTGLISYINSVLGTLEYETMFSRPRRFGKTMACDMLAAYYSVGSSSRELFKGLEIEKDASFEEHLNKHPVIYFDLLAFKSEWNGDDNDWSEFNNKKPTLVQYIEDIIVAEMIQEYPEPGIDPESTLPDAMIAVSRYLKKKEQGKTNGQGETIQGTNTHKFIVIIDEWDMILREEKDNHAMIEEYVKFLRSLFRSKDTSTYLAGAYMTGILPIIRYNSQSSLSDFKERTMLRPLMLAEYVGFTKEDVRRVCQKFVADEQLIKEWYDGYNLPGVGEVYCPSSVMEATMNNDYSSHWTVTAAMEALTGYIYADLDGLADAMNKLLDGENVSIDPTAFQNRLDQVDTRDKVLTVLVHLGYLAYDDYTGTVRIPNLEVRLQMLNAFKESPNKEFFQRIERSEKLLAAAKGNDAGTVAEVLKEIHDERPPIHYNNEQALRYVVLMGFNNSPRSRYTSFEELSSGDGFVDILFKPQKQSSEIPMLVELKYGESANKAIGQIYDKDYIAHLRKEGYHGNVLLVGINYSPYTKEHTCRIEKIKI